MVDKTRLDSGILRKAKIPSKTIRRRFEILSAVLVTRKSSKLQHPSSRESSRWGSGEMHGRAGEGSRRGGGHRRMKLQQPNSNGTRCLPSRFALNLSTNA